jgi:hypothetical protein
MSKPRKSEEEEEELFGRGIMLKLSPHDRFFF